MASGDTLLEWTALSSEPPATGYATLNVRNAHPVLEYDAATTESANFTGILPRNYSNATGITVTLHWMAASATSGVVMWGVATERMNVDLDADNFASVITATDVANATSGITTMTSIALTKGSQMGNLAVGESFRLQVQRLGANASDTMTGDAQLLAIEIKET